MSRECPVNTFSGSSVLVPRTHDICRGAKTWARNIHSSSGINVPLINFIILLFKENIPRQRALRHVRDSFVRNTPPTTKRFARTLCHIHIISHGSAGCVSALSASHAARIHTNHAQGRKPWAGKLLMTGSASCWKKMYATRLQRIVSSGRNNLPDVHQEAPVTHFGPGCNGGISIGIVLRHGTEHGTMTATKTMREILEANRKVGPSF